MTDRARASATAQQAGQPWQAVWIGLDWQVDCWPVNENRIAFRHDVEIRGKPQRGVVRVGAFANYALWVNGEFAGYGPARAFPAHSFYDELDITPLLRPGRNAFAALVDGPTGAAGYSIVTRMGFLLDGCIDSTRGRVPVCTDTAWRARAADWYVRTGLLSSLPTHYQEHVKEARIPTAWQTARPGEGWNAAWFIGPAGTPPWRTLAPRPIPQLREAVVVPPLVWHGRGGKVAVDVRDNLLLSFNAMRLEAGGTVRPAAGGWYVLQSGQVLTFDLGRTRFVRPALDTQGDLSGKHVRLELYYDQTLGDRPTGMDSFGNARAGFADSFTPATGAGHWEALNPRGFRFLTIRAAGQGGCRVKPVPRTVDYPFAESANLETSDAFLGGLWRTSADTLRSATTDVISDCCSRENRFWVFDSCIGAKAAYYTFGESAMWRRCLMLGTEAVQPDGDVFAMAPVSESFDRLYDQTMYWVIGCRDYWLCTGDDELLRASAPAIERFLRLLARQITEEGLVLPPEHAWHWIDWAPVDKRPYSLPVSAWVGWTARVAAEIGAAARMPSLCRIAAEVQRRLRPAIGRFFAAEAGAFRTHVEPRLRLPPSRQPPDWPGVGNPATPAFNLHGNALVDQAGHGTAAQRRAAVAWMAKACVKGVTPETAFGPGWTEIMLAPLFRAGYADAAWRFVRTCYGPFLDHSAPTWGEGFHGQPHNSAHAWGASVNSLIAAHVVGLVPEEPGWRVFRLAPAALPLDFTYALETVAGTISVRRENGLLAARWPKRTRLRLGDHGEAGTGHWRQFDANSAVGL